MCLEFGAVIVVHVPRKCSSVLRTKSPFTVPLQVTAVLLVCCCVGLGVTWMTLTFCCGWICCGLPLTWAIIRLMYSFIHSCTHSFIPFPSLYSMLHSLLASFFPSIRPSIHLYINSFIHPSIPWDESSYVWHRSETQRTWRRRWKGWCSCCSTPVPCWSGRTKPTSKLKTSDWTGRRNLHGRLTIIIQVSEFVEVIKCTWQ